MNQRYSLRVKEKSFSKDAKVFPIYIGIGFQQFFEASWRSGKVGGYRMHAVVLSIRERISYEPGVG